MEKKRDREKVRVVARQNNTSMGKERESEKRSVTARLSIA